MSKKTGIIILAAGNSSRLGTPKQLLFFEGKSLLSGIIEKASGQPDHQVIVVLGSAHEIIQTELTGIQVEMVVNANWEEGMSGSIKKGLQSLLQATPDLKQCIITVCDQPFITAQVFQELKLLAKQTGKGIITTGFADTWGVPVLFSKGYFEELLSLDGQHGAKKMIKKHVDDMAVFPFEPAEIDIDTKEDFFRLKQEMVSVREAKEIIDFNLPKSRKDTEVPLQKASGYTLASNVSAQYSIPNFAQSSMDGYAIRHQEKEQQLTIVDKVPAGATVQKMLQPGQAMRIFTGAPMPIGADTVVMQEKVDVITNNRIQINDSELQSGDNVRPKGSEVAKDAIAIRKGTLLTPAAIGYLAGVGCTHVDIYAAPRVAIILTGDELKRPGESLGFGEVYESNSYQLRSALNQLGVKDQDIKCFRVQDNMQLLTQTIENALKICDVLVLVGGVSVGEYDYVVPAAKACGVEQRFHRIRQKPGKPLFFGTKEDKIIFGLPGNPSSALTCFYLYVVPALAKLMQTTPSIKKVKTRLTHDYQKKAGLTHFLKGSYDGMAATPLHAQESYRLQSFAQANCLIVVPENSESVLAGSEIEAYVL